jgi:hypothetical protein
VKKLILIGILFNLTRLFFTTPQVEAVDEIAVTGEVEADVSQLSIVIERLSPLDPNITMGDEAEYRLKYSHTLPYPAKLTIRASWNASLPVVSYVVGSATDAYGGSSPTINTGNGTISWVTDTIPVSSGEQFVDFTIIGDAVATEGPLTVTVQGQILVPAVTSAVEDQLFYDYQPPATPTPTPTATPTPTPTPTPTQTPTPTPTPTATPSLIPGASPQPPATPAPTSSDVSVPLITKVEVVALNDISAKIRAFLSAPREMKLVFQDENGQIFQVSHSSSRNNIQIFDLTGLSPNTKYIYWFIDAQTQERLTRESFQFITPTRGSEVIPEIFSFYILYKNQLVSHWQDTTLEIQKHNWLASGLPYTIVIRSDQDTTVIDQSWLEVWYLQEQEPVVMPLQHERLNQLQTPIQVPEDSIGADLYMYYKMPNGSLLSIPLGKIGVAMPMRIVDRRNNNPLEHVQVEVYAFQDATQTYKKLELPEVFTTSGWDGVVPVTLPEGNYQFKLSLPGYDPHTIELQWPFNETNNPIGMQPTGNLLMQLWGQTQGFSSGFNYAVLDAVAPVFKNASIFGTAVYIAGLLIALSVVVMVAIKTRLPIHMLPEFLMVFLRGKATVNQEQILVKDQDTQQPISEVEVIVVDPEDKGAEQRAFTNRYGILTIQTTHAAVEVFLSKDGYAAKSTVIIFDSDVEVIELAATAATGVDAQTVSKTLRVLFRIGVELVLMLNLLFQLIILMNFGWVALPLVGITIFANLVWWIYHSTGHPHLNL